MTDNQSRYRVNAGFADGAPYVQVQDRFANAGLRFGLVEAIQIAALLANAAAHNLNLMQQAAAHAKTAPTLVTPSGAPIPIKRDA